MDPIRSNSLFSNYPLYAAELYPPAGPGQTDTPPANTNQAGALYPQTATAAPGAPANDSWGDALRGLSQTGLQKGLEAAKKKATWKGSDSDNNDSSTSLGNVGNEKLPGNLSSLGNYGKGTTIAEFEWHLARIGEIDYKDSGDWGSLSVQGATDFLKVQGRAYYDADFGDWTAKVGAGVQGRVELVGAHYGAEYDSPSLYNLGGHDLDFKTKANADAYVGVTGSAEADVGIGKNTYVDLGAGGFDGASAGLKGSESLGDFGSVNGDMTLWTGVGAKVDVDAGFKDGKFTFNFGAGLALGLGADYDWGFSIDFAAIGDSLYNVGAGAIDFVGDAGKWVDGAASDAADWVGGAADTVGDAAHDAVDAVDDAAGDAVDAVGDAAGDVISDIGDLF